VGDRLPRGIPSSWYLVAYSEDVGADQLVRLRYVGRELVAFRGADGGIAVFDAYCPHLGAHFGVGGRVERGVLRCPFHGWRFDGSGRCVEISYAKRIPPNARATRVRSVEKSGMIFIWHDAAGREPFFELPDLPEWSDPAYTHRWLRYEWTVRTHPQEMAENGLDWQHFPTVHLTDAPTQPRFEFDGPRYAWAIAAAKDYTLQDYREAFELGGENWGMGYTVTRQTGAFRTCVVTGLTPIDEETVSMKLGVIARGAGAEFESALRVYMEEHAVVAQQDFPIWENKRYRETPLLSEADGPIAEYRRWARQFYP
jgi:nitrite reductase/ring-hydroxylating ferredoxin subunit